MDLSAIIDEFNRRKAQAGQRIGEMFTPPKKPDDWFQQMQQGQNAVITPEQRSNVHKELADIAERMAQGMVPPMIRERERAMRTDPSAAAKPFTSDEIKQATPFVTGAAPIAFHGTPHTFDKFDASKIGTGQGAQSYGHGLYFAENPETAKSYADSLAKFQFGNESLNTSQAYDRLRSHPQLRDFSGSELHHMMMDILESKNTGQNIADRFKPGQEQEAYKIISSKLSTMNKNIYQVNIPDQHAAKMLDWDKPLSEQAKNVQDAVKQSFPNGWVGPKDPTGQQIVEMFGGHQSNTAMQSAGIPGIKYLDQGSRIASGKVEQVPGSSYLWRITSGDGTMSKTFTSQGEAEAAAAKQGTRNFVVFDPAILEDVTRK